MPDVTILDLTAKTAAGTQWIEVQDDGGGAGSSGRVQADAIAALGAGRLIGVQYITATGAGVYNPSADVKSIIIELVGGGGGGGGAPSGSSSQGATSGGGGGGGYLRARLTADFAGAAYNVGAGGPGGGAGVSNGTAGGDTTFTSTAPVTYTAPGGVAGSAGTAAAVPRCSAVSGITATPTNGDVNIPGQSSVGGMIAATSAALGSIGGGSPYGTGGQSSRLVSAPGSAPGQPGTGYGAGGSGATTTTTGAAAAGGDGADGLIVIWEFS